MRIDLLDNAGNESQSITSIFDLPYSEVIQLCKEFVEADSTNNIKKRSRLLRQYPELFDKEVQTEIEQILKIANQATKQINSRNKIVHLDPKLFKK